MKYTSTSIAIALAGVITLGPGSTTISAQVAVDLENKYSSVGAIMVWRVDEAGKAIELRGFASGTLIGDRAMVTAGHFTAPAKALGSLPPSIRMFVSFSPTDAKDPKTWIPVVRQGRIHRCRTARRRLNATRPTRSWLHHSSRASPTLDWYSWRTRRPGSERRASPSPVRSTDPRAHQRPSSATG
jgi:hypothetical protein